MSGEILKYDAPTTFVRSSVIPQGLCVAVTDNDVRYCGPLRDLPMREFNPGTLMFISERDYDTIERKTRNKTQIGEVIQN